MTYRVVLRARSTGEWQVYFFNGKERLFMIPHRSQSSAEYMAAKLVDELLRNQQDFTCDVQDETGRRVPIDLLRLAQRRKVRGVS
jgi:hypothetical protein